MSGRENDGAEGGGRSLRPARERVPTPPTPVRSSLGDTAFPDTDAAPPEAPTPEVVVELEGRPWTVRVLGRSTGGPAESPTPFLLLGFFDDPEATAPAREALVVGRSLEELGGHRLDAAFGASREPPGDKPRPTIFPEIPTRGGKRDR